MVEEQRRAIAEGLGAIQSGDNSGAARLHWQSEEASRRLSKSAARYLSLLGRQLPALSAIDRDGLAGLREGITRLAQSIHVGYFVSLGQADQDRRSMASDAVSRIIARLGLLADPADSSSCRPGWTHLIDLTVGVPECEEPGMGSSCEIPLDILLRDCTSGSMSASARIVGGATRGAAMTRELATGKAWKKLGRGTAGLAAEFARVLSSSIPIPYQPGGGQR